MTLYRNDNYLIEVKNLTSYVQVHMSGINCSSTIAYGTEIISFVVTNNWINSHITSDLI